MKLFDVDWSALLRDLSRWSALPLNARRVLLDELKTSGYVPVSHFGAHLEVIVASGIPHYEPERARLRIGDERRELLRVLHAMDRHRVFTNASPPALVKYMEEHFSQVDIERLATRRPPGMYGPITRHGLWPRVASATWTGDLLDAESDMARLAWAAARGASPASGCSMAALRALQALARTLLEANGAVPLRDLVAQCPQKERPILASTIHTGLGLLVLFAGMRDEDLEPMIGVWPAAVRELNRAPLPRPAVVVPTEQFEHALLMEDMTALLAAVVAAPVRLRAADLNVFARERTLIESRLVAIPEWVSPLIANEFMSRVDVAGRALESAEFVKVSTRNASPHLERTAKGMAWLSQSPEVRLASLIDPIRSSKASNPSKRYADAEDVSFFPFSLPFFQVPKVLRLRDSLTRAFLDTGGDFVSMEEFLDHEAIERNPFLSLPEADRESVYGSMHFGGNDPRDAVRHLWRNALTEFLAFRLTTLGGASIGLLASGAICFRLTDIGRYLLGARATFSYGTNSSCDVVVQPNFDVVFLGVSPSLEAIVARFAERVGMAPGLTFRITKASVLRGAEGGASAVDVIGALSRISSKAVPQNVQREIAGWMALVRHAAVRTLEVIDCADVESADRVMAVVGGKGNRLTPTLVEVPDSSRAARAGFMKKLRSGGIFLEEPLEET